VLVSARDRRWVTVGGEEEVRRNRVLKRYYHVGEARNSRGIRKR
jgi:hypothetical protein